LNDGTDKRGTGEEGKILRCVLYGDVYFLWQFAKFCVEDV
jgi:hypothetical protein